MSFNFIEQYTTYASENEAAPHLHTWAGLTVLSSAIGRKVKLLNGPFVFYPNLFTVLVGDPGCGKSTALSYGKKMLRKVKGLPMSASVESVQAFLQWMGGSNLKEGQRSPCWKTYSNPITQRIEEYNQATIIVHELATFMGIDPHAWVGCLTAIGDDEVYDVKTKNAGVDVIVGPYVTLFACMTPECSQQLQSAKIIGTGFARRALWIWAGNRDKPLALPNKLPEHDAAEASCLEWLNDFGTVKGHFEWRDCRNWYKHWYDNFRNPDNLRKISTPQTKGYIDTKNVHLFRIAMLLSLAERKDLVITVEHFERALQLLGVVEGSLFKIFGGTGRNEDAPVALAILDFLEQQDKPVSYKKVFGQFMHELQGGVPAFDGILRQLCLMDKIVKWDQPIPEVSATAIATLMAVPKIHEAFIKKHQKVPLQSSTVPPLVKPSDVGIDIDLREMPLERPAEKSLPESQASVKPAGEAVV